jgi:hypothetical protein
MATKFQCECGFALRLPDGFFERHEEFICPTCGVGFRDATPVPFTLAVRLSSELTEAEKAELFPDVTDPTLLGERIAALTSALGIPPCGGCTERKNWLNRAHQLVRDLICRPMKKAVSRERSE